MSIGRHEEVRVNETVNHRVGGSNPSRGASFRASLEENECSQKLNLSLSYHSDEKIVGFPHG